MRTQQYIYSLFILLFFTLGCKSDKTGQTVSSDLPELNLKNKEMPPPPPQLNAGFMPTWLKNSVIYEVNLRQYTPEGTFEAFMDHIPRLVEMDVDVLWFMPIYPISKAKRKGTLGSYYAVADYKDVNPEHGTLEDFKKLVKKAHEHHMKVIIDWVPNHTGWDHPWITEHPEFYTKNDQGEITDPIDPSTGESWGWTDVADLNYDNPDMRKAMLDDMEFWVKSVGIDGFRQDVAHGVPLDFWVEYRVRMARYKNLFHLAEAELPELNNKEIFHASYGWSFHHLMNEIAQGKKGASEITNWYKNERSKFKKGFLMHFTSNHDENSWSGTEFERMKELVNVMAVLSFTFDGAPLVYSGQEEPLKKRLEFFEKDVIPFKKFERADFYRKLILLKHRNKALWHGDRYAVEPEIIRSDDDVLVFKKVKDNDQAIVVLNFSDKLQEVTFPFKIDKMLEVMQGRELILEQGAPLRIKPYGYRVFADYKHN